MQLHTTRNTQNPTRNTHNPRWVLIGGYLVNPASIPIWLRWVRNLSPLSFAFEVRHWLLLVHQQW